jgi:thiol-disulfide isomerase/thioredoxin
LRTLIACLLLAPLMIGGCDRQTRQPEQGQAPRLDTNLANAVAGQTPDEVTAPAAPAAAAPDTIDTSHKGAAAPGVSFTDPAGKRVTVADYRGRPVLLNLWATWCAPCVKEMPTLDALAGAEGSKLVVLTVSQDLDGKAKVDPFFAAHHFAHLKPYLDPKLALSTALQANLPTTILYDAHGKEVARVTGGFDWTSPAARQLIASATGA